MRTAPAGAASAVRSRWSRRPLAYACHVSGVSSVSYTSQPSEPASAHAASSAALNGSGSGRGSLARARRAPSPGGRPAPAPAPAGAPAWPRNSSAPCATCSFSPRPELLARPTMMRIMRALDSAASLLTRLWLWLLPGHPPAMSSTSPSSSRRYSWVTMRRNAASVFMSSMYATYCRRLALSFTASNAASSPRASACPARAPFATFLRPMNLRLFAAALASSRAWLSFTHTSSTAETTRRRKV
mmetsp:Transcript_12384/g.42934  ORF Transcript_12384/g.42934 Transcript_12384/m.42934 type:complete len:243 (-) Transcript_12384:871-1599(-)